LTTGLALAFAFSSKYTTILLPVAVVIAVIMRQSYASGCANQDHTSACVVAALVVHAGACVECEPRLDLVCLPAAARSVGAQGSAVWRLEARGDFFGGQAALASPILFIMMSIAVGGRASVAAQRRSDSRWRCWPAVSFTFSYIAACVSAVEPNWPAPR